MRHNWLKLQAIIVVLAALSACAGPSHQVDKSDKRLDLAKDLLGRHEDVAAETQVHKALAFDPDNADAYNTLGLIYMVRANRNVSLVEYEGCLKGNIAAGLRSEADDNMRKAENNFAQAVKLAPNFGEAWQNRAVAAMYFQNWDKAIKYETQALGNLGRLKSEPLARANLGWAYYRKQDFIRAAAELLQATQRSPGFCLGDYRLAQVLFERKDYEEALQRLDRFVKKPKECPIQEAQYLAGQVQLRLKNSAGARRAFAACAQMAPQSCEARKCNRALRDLP